MRYRTLGRAGIRGGDMRPRRRAAGRTVIADDAVARALAIGPGSSTAERTIDITTLGRCSGIRAASRCGSTASTVAGT